MYKYSKRTIYTNFGFAGILIMSALFVNVDIWYRVVIGLVSIMILRDAFKEKNVTFDLLGDRLMILSKGAAIKEIMYRDMKYLTITRRNKRWIVIADDDRILFTIKPKIEKYDEMVAKLISVNKSNKKLEVHDYIKKTYKK